MLHRLPEKDWKIKSATISQYGDGTYYISILFEYEDFPVSPAPVTEEQVVGLDYKSAGLYMNSNGNKLKILSGIEHVENNHPIINPRQISQFGIFR